MAVGRGGGEGPPGGDGVPGIGGPAPRQGREKGAQVGLGVWFPTLCDEG